MSFLNDLYQKSVAENERNLHFWGDYLNNLKSLDFSVYADKLKVPALVPIGSRIFFRGELKHTNEVTVALGADYFVKCSLAQTEVLRNHRIKDAESKLDSFMKEKEYLENQLSFTKQNLFKNDGQEIVEVYSEEEDKEWRKKHRENIRKYKQGASKQNNTKEEFTDEELWNRLEELELEEELENELLDNYNEIRDKRKDNLFLVNEENNLMTTFKVEQSKQNDNTGNDATVNVVDDKAVKVEEKINGRKDNKVAETSESTKSKIDLLQQVFDKQTQLEDKLLELKNRNREPSKTENELMSKLDEMEQLDELEDEMDRLEDILETGDKDSDDEVPKTNATKLKKSISFADQDDGETLEITFKHSDVEPNNGPYDPKQGICKPSDIYQSHAHLFNKKSTSILKKSKFEPNVCNIGDDTVANKQVKITEDGPENEVYPVHETIIVKDVMEKASDSRSKIEMDARPTSLFKKRRMQNKS